MTASIRGTFHLDANLFRSAGVKGAAHRKQVMLPSTRLKLASSLFGAFGALGMFWWSGAYSVVNALLLAFCGAGAGSGLYWLMRGCIVRGRVPEH